MVGSLCRWVARGLGRAQGTEFTGHGGRLGPCSLGPSRALEPPCGRRVGRRSERARHRRWPTPQKRPPPDKRGASSVGNVATAPGSDRQGRCVVWRTGPPRTCSRTVRRRERGARFASRTRSRRPHGASRHREIHRSARRGRGVATGRQHGPLGYGRPLCSLERPRQHPQRCLDLPRRPFGLGVA